MRHKVKRVGLTLPELLVAVSIAAVLAALTAAALVQVYKAERVKSANRDVFRLNELYQQERTALLDKLPAEEVPQPVLAWCGHDHKLARAVWDAVRIRSKFPVTYADATTPIVINGYTCPQFNTRALPPVPNEFAESSVLLSRILEEHVPETRQFTDQWGGPIGVRTVVTIDHNDVLKNWVLAPNDPRAGVRAQLLPYTKNRLVIVVSHGRDGFPSDDDLLGR